MHGEFNEQLSAYALGALDEAERADLEAHLASGCADCDRELFEFDRTASTLAFAVTPATPTEGLRVRVLNSISAAGTAPRISLVRDQPGDVERRRSRPAGAALAIGALLAAAAFAIAFMAWALVSSGSRLDEAVRQLADARRSEDTRKAELERQRQLVGLVVDPAARSTALLSTSGDSAAGLNVVWHPEQKRGVLVARDLPSVEGGKTYELWLVSGSTPIPAAVFNTDASGNALVEIERLPDAGPPNVFAITVEPAGGSRLPTGKILMAGQYSGA